MPRTVALPCESCNRKFSGDETFKRHRVIAGDRYRCLTPEELIARGFRYGDHGVWRRPRLDQMTLPSLSVTPESDQLPDPSVNGAGWSHRDGPDTERVSAALVAPRSGTWRMRVLEAIREAGDVGLTDAELAVATAGYLYTVAPRRKELVEMGWVKDSGRRRQTPMARPAIVWILTDGAQAVSA